MVRFEENKLVIEVETSMPHETWLEMHASLCDIIRYVRQDTMVDKTFYAAIDLLHEMLPDWEIAKKMRL
jgi:hypothetical protein